MKTEVGAMIVVMGKEWQEVVSSVLRRAVGPRIDVWRQISAAFPTSESTPSLEPFDFSRVPSPDYIFKNGLAGFTSYMALTGFTDPNEAAQTMFSEADDYHRSKSWGKGNLNTYLNRKIEEKKKRYNKLGSGPN